MNSGSDTETSRNSADLLEQYKRQRLNLWLSRFFTLLFAIGFASIFLDRNQELSISSIFFYSSYTDIGVFVILSLVLLSHLFLYAKGKIADFLNFSFFATPLNPIIILLLFILDIFFVYKNNLKVEYLIAITALEITLFYLLFYLAIKKEKKIFNFLRDGFREFTKNSYALQKIPYRFGQKEYLNSYFFRYLTVSDYVKRKHLNIFKNAVNNIFDKDIKYIDKNLQSKVKITYTKEIKNLFRQEPIDELKNILKPFENNFNKNYKEALYTDMFLIAETLIFDKFFKDDNKKEIIIEFSPTYEEVKFLQKDKSIMRGYFVVDFKKIKIDESVKILDIDSKNKKTAFFSIKFLKNLLEFFSLDFERYLVGNFALGYSGTNMKDELLSILEPNISNIEKLITLFRIIVFHKLISIYMGFPAGLLNSKIENKKLQLILSYYKRKKKLTIQVSHKNDGSRGAVFDDRVTRAFLILYHNYFSNDSLNLKHIKQIENQCEVLEELKSVDSKSAEMERVREIS